MVKKISHTYPHVGAVLSPHADVAHFYPLSLSLHLSLTCPHGCGSRGQRGARGRPGPRWRHGGVGCRRAQGGSRAQGGPSSTTKVSGARDPAPSPRWRSASLPWVSHLISAKLPISSPSPFARAPPSGQPSSAASSCSSKLSPAQVPPSLSPTTHLCPRPLREVPRAMAR
jgi:hypothetical protein